MQVALHVVQEQEQVEESRDHSWTSALLPPVSDKTPPNYQDEGSGEGCTLGTVQGWERAGS